MSNMNIKDLLINKLWDDKHYLLCSNVKLLKWNKVELYFKANDPVIKLDEISEFKNEPLIYSKNKKDLLSKNTWLLSMWVILLFWNDIKSSNIALIKRDENARFDPNCLTMPAWRLDTLLSTWCYSELLEEFISWNSQYYFSYFSNSFKNKELKSELKKIQEKRIKDLRLIKKQYREIVCKTPDLNIFYKVWMYFEWKKIDLLDSIFLFVDESNKTLEFRMVLLSPEKDILNFFDWDWFKREMFLVNLFNLKNWELVWKYAKHPSYELEDIKWGDWKLLLSNTLKEFLKLYP